MVIIIKKIEKLGHSMDQAGQEELISKKVDDIFNECMSRLEIIRKKKQEVVNTFDTKTDNRRIEKIKKQIDLL